MKLKEILQMTDNLMFAKTGKHLDDLQQTILQGTLEGKKYFQIAEEHEYAHGYVRDSAAELWQILSEVLGEEVKKSNCRSTFERLNFSNHSSQVTEYIQIGNSNINICNDLSTKSILPHSSLSKKSNALPHFDLDKAPKLGKLYGRNNELQCLKEWILKDHSQLIAIAGLTGIGKTALSLHLVDQIKYKFDYVIYRNISDFQSLSDLQLDLLESFSVLLNTNNIKISLKNEIEQRATLLKFLEVYRCLIILDDVQVLFEKGQLAACYQNQYQNYAIFFEAIGNKNHQSCMILNTREVPREVIQLSELQESVCLLYLTGVGKSGLEILKDRGLQNQDKWEQLLLSYGDNPLWLTLTLIIIKELFNGKVNDFLKQERIILSNDLIMLLNNQFEWLSANEKQMMFRLSQSPETISISQLLAENDLHTRELLNVLQSLVRRSLVEKIEADETLFKISTNVIVEYYLNYFSNIF